VEWGRVAATELMPRLVGGDTETVCGKLKKGKGFLEPNFEALLKLRFCLYRNTKKSSGRIISRGDQGARTRDARVQMGAAGSEVFGCSCCCQ
jgi:hypothetical protein